MKKRWILALALVLPLGMAAWVFFLPDLANPMAFLILTVALACFLIWPVKRLLVQVGNLEDLSLSLVLAFVYLLVPSGAVILLVNQSMGRTNRFETHVVMDRYPRLPDGGEQSWIFLWAEDHIEKMRTSPSDPLYLCQPGDSVRLQYIGGLLGLEYRDHAYRVQ